MAITHNPTDVTWPTAANSKSVATATSEDSEEFNLDDTCVRAQIEMKADNAGSPAAGDTIDFYLLQTLGDPDAAEPGTDEFDTPSHALHLGRIDTNDEDPGIITRELPLPNKGAKLRATNSAASNSIVVSATILEQRAA